MPIKNINIVSILSLAEIGFDIYNEHWLEIHNKTRFSIRVVFILLFLMNIIIINVKNYLNEITKIQMTKLAVISTVITSLIFIQFEAGLIEENSYDFTLISIIMIIGLYVFELINRKFKEITLIAILSFNSFRFNINLIL
jgi:hypothetical protein